MELGRNCNNLRTKSCVWPKPPTYFWSLVCDGTLTTTRDGYGDIIQDLDGSPIMAYGGISNGSHMLWVGYFVLYKGLMLAFSSGYTKLWITMDSKLVVDILVHHTKSP